MSNDTTWLPVAEAARVLGLTEQALRKRLARGTMESRKNNRGNLVVLVSTDGERQAQPGLPAPNPMGTTSGTTGPDTRLEPRRALAGESEALPLSAHREIVDAIQAAHSATLAAIQGQAEQLRSDMASERKRHDAEIERQRADHDAELVRLTSHWQERCDRAEIMADEANSALRQLVEAALRLPPPPPTTTASAPARLSTTGSGYQAERRRPLWHKLFG